MKRREFIQKTGVSGAAGTFCALQLQAAEEVPKPMFRGRIYKSVKYGGRVNLERLKKLKELGFDGVEGSAPGMDLVGLKKACSEVGLPMHGVVYNKHWKMRLSSPNEEVRDIGRKGLEDAIRESKAVGGSSVLLVPGAVKGKGETHDHVWERSITEIRKVLPLASHLGIRVLIETVWNGFCYKPEQFRDYLDAIDNPWVGAYYDIGNMQKFAPSHEWIRVLGSRIVKLDVKDWGVKNGFCPLGKGDVDWEQVRRELDKIDFSGWVTREGSDGGDDKTAALMNRLLGL
jgi:hexulose-6-phosphate isomerase|tara:strand:- start:318 stop:1178 length:861 start_codon:yes stop_codon:yes gene_type:complete